MGNTWKQRTGERDIRTSIEFSQLENWKIVCGRDESSLEREIVRIAQANEEQGENEQRRSSMPYL